MTVTTKAYDDLMDKVKVIGIVAQLRLERAILMMQCYAEMNGVPVIRCSFCEAMIEWAEKPETREAVGIDDWLKDY